MNEDLQPVNSFAEIDILKDEVYHNNYSHEYMEKCDELGLENIEEYNCLHSYCCDCGTVGECEPLIYFCVYCSKKKVDYDKKDVMLNE